MENIKEALSIKYIEAIANYNGLKTSSVYPDHGTDLFVYEVEPRLENGKNRYFDTGRELKIQLKATTEAGIVIREGTVVYDLETKAFNDLVERINNERPLILILFILPLEYTDWLTLDANQLILKKCAYYYMPEVGEEKTHNVVTQRIFIDQENIISVDTLNDLMERYG